MAIADSRVSRAGLTLICGLVACGDSGSPSQGAATVNVINGASVQDQDVVVLVGDDPKGVVCYPCSSGLIVPSGETEFVIEVQGNPSVVTTVGANILAGERYDLAVFDNAGSIGGLLVRNENGPATGGEAKLHLIHAGMTQGVVDVYITPTDQALDAVTASRAGLAFGEVWYAPVDGATPQIRITAAGSKVPLAEAFLDDGRTFVVFGEPGFLFGLP